MRATNQEPNPIGAAIILCIVMFAFYFLLYQAVT